MGVRPIRVIQQLNPLSSGAFCEVFNVGGGRILKAFYQIRSKAAPGADPTLIPRMMFNHERRVYSSLQAFPELEVYVPRFLGAASPLDYPLQSTRTFVPFCGLILELIPGNDVKLAELPRPIQRRVEEVIEKMQRRIGLGDPWDASCFVPGTRADFTIIDFATPTERLHELDVILEKHGTVPVHLQRLLGILGDEHTV